MTALVEMISDRSFYAQLSHHHSQSAIWAHAILGLPLCYAVANRTEKVGYIFIIASHSNSIAGAFISGISASIGIKLIQDLPSALISPASKRNSLLAISITHQAHIEYMPHISTAASRKNH